MLKASELRIGNLVKGLGWNSEEIEIKVDYKIIGSLHEKELSSMHIRPIPLTEEWLVKFGFACVHKGNKHYSMRQSIRNNNYIHFIPTINDMWHLCFSDTQINDYRDYITATAIKHVHQLQNLYHALTGEELIIKKSYEKD